MEPKHTTEQLYAAYKPLLFSLAYRMLGRVMDAEDIVQEAFLSLNGALPEHVRHPKAYLCKIVTNRCIDLLRSASKQREVYVGPWLPEPLVAEEDGSGSGLGDPSHHYVQKESVSTAYLLLLQQLSWVERAVFLLREVLQYEYDEIGEIVGKSGTNCRQIFHRAKRSLGTHAAPAAGDLPSTGSGVQLHTPAAGSAAGGLVEQFVSALASGDMAKLLRLLSEDAALYSDGGGKVTAAVRPILGAERISRFLAGLLEKVQDGFSYRFAVVNGYTGIVTYVHGRPLNVFSFHAENERIEAIYIVVNPEKLKHVK
ncbi:RNA polymerase sigma-70 factor [Paenibacillus sp.]|uniref:RNA polymerase sigma-70 factor n=1 Tax=Paenibacillus TaxID=44249 RepID=UPI003561B96B